MKLTEKIFAALIIMSLIMKSQLIQGSNGLFVISIMLLSCMYFLMGFALFNGIRLRNIFIGESYSGISVLRIVGAALSGISLSMVCIGITFKIMVWPGAQIMLMAGMIPSIAIFVTVLIKYIIKKDRFYLHALIRFGIFVTLGMVLFKTSGITLIKIQFRDHPAFIRAFEEYEKNPQSDELYQKMEIERNRATLDPEDLREYEKASLSKQEMDQEEAEELETIVNRERKFPLSEGWTNDFEQLLKKEEIKHLDSTITNFTYRTGISIHLVTLDSISRYDTAETAAYNLIEEWKSSDDELIVLMIVSKADRSVVIAADDATEEVLTQTIGQEILKRSMIPDLKKGKYYSALKKGTIEVMKVLDNSDLVE